MPKPPLGRKHDGYSVTFSLVDELDRVRGTSRVTSRVTSIRIRSDRRPGYDLTFSAPKGVSLLWALGSGEVRDATSVAHDAAVAAVLDQLSTEACYVRCGHDGVSLIEARGFVGAAFQHRTSRAGDPQLHTHVVVPNLVEGADGKWSAPDGRHLYSWKITAGTLYRSALRAELAPLGLAWNVRRNGLSEPAGIPKRILRAFSTRGWTSKPRWRPMEVRRRRGPRQQRSPRGPANPTAAAASSTRSGSAGWNNWLPPSSPTVPVVADQPPLKT
ncbi:MAG: MobF family relaxase [Acidimicrobiales bacterium]